MGSFPRAIGGNRTDIQSVATDLLIVTETYVIDLCGLLTSEQWILIEYSIYLLQYNVRNYDSNNQQIMHM